MLLLQPNAQLIVLYIFLQPHGHIIVDLQQAIYI